MFRENEKMICAGCFAETADENICYSCGRTLSESSHEIALKKGTVLKERYVVGKLNTFDDLVNRYTAYDKVEGKIVLITEYMPKILASRTYSTAELNIANENNYPNYNNGLQVFSSAASYFKETTQKGMQKCLDVFYENFTAYAVFEKIEGQSLGIIMKNFNSDSALVVNLLKPLLVSLEDLHRQGYNFGQISPMKIVFRNGKADDPVLCDADLYSHVDLNMDTYCFTGKLSAFSPIEAYMSRYVKSNSNDIYSLCLSLYSCFDERIAANIEENKTIDKSIIRAKGFSNKMADIFAKACSADFADRYLNAFEIMCDIGLRKREPQQGAKNNKKSKKKTIALVCTGFFTVILILLIIFCIRFCGNSSTGAGASDGNKKEDADITEESANDSEGSSTDDVSEDGESGEVSEDEKIPTSGSIFDNFFQTDDTMNIDDEKIVEDDTSSKGEDNNVGGDDNPTDNDDKPVDSGDNPTDNDDKPVDSDDNPTDNDDKPVDSDDNPTDSDDKPVDSDDNPTDNDDKPVDSDDNPTDSDDKPVDSDDNPTDSDDKPVDSDDNPTDNDDNLAENK